MRGAELDVQICRPGYGLDAAEDELDPGICHGVVGAEEAWDIPDARVARVGVAEDEDGVPGGVGGGVGGDLFEVGGSGGDVVGFDTGGVGQ